ncbi:MAG: ATP-dependent DNA helicase RecG [Eggerthellaceae bacterium]|nr:ATP-dependent DNA helicase RecG [Eggerthellaceae bacterium]
MTEKATREIDRTKATLALDAPVTSVRLVSPKRAQALGKLSISTVRDLVGNYPRRYIDMSRVATIAAARIGDTCTIKARVHEVKVKRPKPRVVLAEVTIVDDTGVLIITAFSQPWLADQLKKGATVAVSGEVAFNYGYKRMTNPYIEQLEGTGEDFHGMIVPVHPLTAAIKAGMMRRLVGNALEEVAGVIDPLPLSLRAKYRLMSRNSALNSIHFPHTMDEQHEARRRLAYEEVLLLELMLMQEGGKRSEGRKAVEHVTDGPAVAALAAAVPFELTGEQIAARDDILGRMAAPRAANHMLLGDVGTGKTIVAAFACAAAADTDGQALFMAPTEILARQHAASLGPLLDAAGVTWGILTGSTQPDERAGILERAVSGELSVLFGTHALLEDDVVLANCTLAVIDEQQRFGVDQRAALLAKGECPDALYLTATPIPRTLALALFGNLSLSYIKERPKATAPRKTFLHTLADRGRAYDAAQAALARGEQVYVVCPLVGEKQPDPEKKKGARDEEEDVYEFERIAIEDERDMTGGNAAAAEAEAAFLQSKVFVDYEVGLVHGKLPAAEKQEVMDRFRIGEIGVLVATTVIEVGVDVPNATVMIVEDADRFGLSQLHQLRGRVGRGDLPGEVHLVSGTKSEKALERLAAMERTDDGFELASYDLSLRREGDILGNRQHGASLLKLVNVVRDGKLIEAAHADAEAILEDDPVLQSAQYRALAREARVVYKRAEDISGG